MSNIDLEPRETEVNVHDRPTEKGVWIGNVLTGLLLAAALWVGSSVEDLKEAVVILATNQDHNSQALGELKAEAKSQDRRIDTLERFHPEFYGGKRYEQQ